MSEQTCAPHVSGPVPEIRIARSARVDEPTASDPIDATVAFTRHSVGPVATLIRAQAARAGVAPRDMEDLLIAVSEIVTNAIRYAGGGAITVRRVSLGLLTEIRDNGPGLPDRIVVDRPAEEGTDQRGLWLARRLCRHFDLVSTPYGVTVRIITPCRIAVATGV